jgi:hypothetical protein
VREPRQVEAEVVRRRWLAAPARDGVRVWPNSLVRDDARAWRGTGGTRPHQHGSIVRSEWLEGVNSLFKNLQASLNNHVSIKDG